ncbi:hypothetical protein [Burkholderia sp. Ac-20365]|uniref:hypothetical protein n=1 Tax=Burkholderia sp. Ac-20365 TaxID=2703897 RepID=UPI00197C151D|nr:hypothetical protein [Burkholderia sp. Ac-20365]MBN3760898.1 hypothetical protein [Burkholderia sp. Ac-20365]
MKTATAAAGLIAPSATLVQVTAEESNRVWQAQQTAFETAIGYDHSEAVYMAMLKEVLAGALGRSYDVIRTPWQWGEWSVVLEIDPGRRPSMGHFGLLDHGRQKCLRIKPCQIAVSPYHCVEWERVNDALAELLQEGDLSLEQVWFLTGAGWTPVRKAVTVQVAELVAVEA